MQGIYPDLNINSRVEGYMINTPIPAEIHKDIARLQCLLGNDWGDSLWLTPVESLHITLLDWFAPLIDYGVSKKLLYHKYFAHYNNQFMRAISGYGPISITFNEVRVTPQAVIIVGTDKGQFNAIRKKFLRAVDLLPGTKQPPTIIHTTIARFVKSLEQEQIEEKKRTIAYNIETQMTVSEFRLIRERIAPQLKYDLLKYYPLESSLDHSSAGRGVTS